MMEAYCGIGKEIADAQGERAEYGKQLLKYLAEQLTKEVGASWGDRQLRRRWNRAECKQWTLRALIDTERRSLYADLLF